MESQMISQKVIQALQSIAPESIGESLDTDVSIQEQLDLDSVDILHFLGQLETEFQIKIPQQEYQTFLTIGGATRYLGEHITN